MWDMQCLNILKNMLNKPLSEMILDVANMPSDKGMD